MNTKYVVVFIVILTSVVAVVLSGLREVTKEQAKLNEAIFNKRAVLAAVDDYLGEGVTSKSLTDAEVLELFDSKITQKIIGPDATTSVESSKYPLAENIDMAKERKVAPADRVYPLYIYENDGQQFYIVSVYGKGLWDAIWGNIALKSDLNTIAGVSFDHKGETPGLGAEIKDNPAFGAEFKGKTLFDGSDFVSVAVVKGEGKGMHEVDGISGATVTSVGVSDMIDEGMQPYLPYLENLKN